jgi:polysaccharide biosynthesis transport protein
MMEKEDKLALEQTSQSLAKRRRAELVVPATVVDEDQAVNLRAYLKVLSKRRWAITAIAFAVLTVGIVATLKQKPDYRSSAMLEIEKENPNILTVQELFQIEDVSDTYLVTQYRVLQSENLARRVIAQLHLDENKEFSPHARPPAAESTAGGAGQAARPDARTEEEVLKEFEDHLSVDPIRQSRLVKISFESQDPRLAASVVGALADSYIEQNLENRWNATQKAAQWLSQQLDGLKIKLEKSEDELQQYAQSNGLLFLESEQGQTENILDERLRQLQEELTKAQADLYQRESLYRLVQAGSYDSLPGVVDNQLMQNLTLRLADLESRYAQLATTFSPDYPKVKELQNQMDATRGMLHQERQRVADKMRNDYTAAARREALVEQAFDEQQKRANDVAAREVQYGILKREVDTNKQLYQGLLGRLKEAGVSAGLKASNIRIVDSPVTPVRPVRPMVALNLSLAALLGLTCGVSFAFLAEHLDNTLKSSEDVERFLQVPALASIPSADSLNGHRRGVYGLPPNSRLLEKGNGNGNGKGLLKPEWFRIDEVNTQYAALPEAFRGLRTSVLLSTAGRPPRSLMITSAQPGEGKSTVSTNLAISLAQLGQKVLLIDADLRRPCLHKIFQIRSAAGLVGYLTGMRPWRETVIPTTVCGLDVIPCGPVPPNPVELLSSDLVQALIEAASEQYTTVLFDTPPILNVTDSRVLAGQVEGVLLVVKGNATPRELARRAQASAYDVGANIIGVVLNRVDARSGEYYYYYQNYHYGSEDEPGIAEEAKN